jgi:hypothetical protein
MAVARNRFEFLTETVKHRQRAVSLLKPPCGGFRIETATWIQKPEVV